MVSVSREGNEGLAGTGTEIVEEVDVEERLDGEGIDIVY